jgi:hypothetical protein
MHREVSAIDRGLQYCRIFGNAGAGLKELAVYRPNMDSAGVVGFHSAGDLQQLLTPALTLSKGRSSRNFMVLAVVAFRIARWVRAGMHY